MWAKWAPLYNRAKSANAALCLFDRAWQAFLFVTGPPLIAWASTTWHWYWNTFSWAGVAIAFLVSWILIPGGFLLLGAAMRYWRKSTTLAWRNCHHLIDIGQSSLFLDPPEYEIWKAKIIFKKSINNVQVRLDFSANSGGVGYNFWRGKRGLVLGENLSFVLGAERIIDLIERDNRGDVPFWRWATGEPLVFTCHSCQLVFLAAQEPPDYLDFIVDFHYEENLSHDGKTPSRYEKTPSLIGEGRFLYAREWKKNDRK